MGASPGDERAEVVGLPADVYPRQAVGSVYGLASMGSGFGGMVFTLLTGWMVDSFGYKPVFMMFGLTPLICVMILWRALGPRERRALPERQESPVQ